MADGGQLAAITIVTPLVEDYAYLARIMRDDEKAQFAAMTGADSYVSDIAARAYAATPGPAWAMLGADGRPFFAGGVEPIRPGVYAAWMIGSPEGWELHWHAITRFCRRVLRQAMEQGAHRIEVTTLASRTPARAWYRDFLGMHYEGTHHKATADGQDVVVYARVSA